MQNNDVEYGSICHAFIQKQMGFFHQRSEYALLFVVRIKGKWFHLLFTKRTISPFRNWFFTFLFSMQFCEFLHQTRWCPVIASFVIFSTQHHLKYAFEQRLKCCYSNLNQHRQQWPLMDSSSCCHRGGEVSLWHVAETKLVCNRLLCYVLTAHTQTYTEIKF